MDITLTLRKLVDKSGKTQRELALRADMSEVYLSRLLHEPDLHPGVNILDRLAGVLGVKIDEILHPESYDGEYIIVPFRNVELLEAALKALLDFVSDLRSCRKL